MTRLVFAVTAISLWLIFVAMIFFPRGLMTALNVANTAAGVLLAVAAVGLVLAAVRGARRAVPQLRRDVAAIWRYQRAGNHGQLPWEQVR